MNRETHGHYPNFSAKATVIHETLTENLRLIVIDARAKVPSEEEIREHSDHAAKHKGPSLNVMFVRSKAEPQGLAGDRR